MIIGKLAVNLGLNSSSFDRGMPRSTRHIRTLNDEVKATAVSLPTLQNAIKAVAVVVTGLAVAAAGAAYGGVRTLRTEMVRLDKIGKTAQKLGMMPESLVGLQHGASLAGIESNKLDMAIQRMTRRLAEAANGGGEARDALAELHLNAAELSRMTPDQVLMRVADAMAGVESQGDRVRLAFKLFDAEGVDLVRMLEGGSAAIRQAMQDAEELGLTFSQIDHTKIAMANDAMFRLEESTKALKTQLAIDFAPLFTTVADTITEAMVGATAAVNDHTRALATAGNTYGLVAESVFMVGDAIDLVGKGIRLQILNLDQLSITALEGAKSLAELFGQDEKARELASAIDSMKSATAKTAISLGVDMAFDESLGDKMRAKYQEILDQVNNAKPKPMGDGLLDVDALNEQTRRIDEMKRRGEQLAESLQTPFEVLEDRIREANKLLEAGALGEGAKGWETYQRAIAAVRQDYAALVAEMSESTGPKLIEAGSQEHYAAMDRWNAMQEQMKEPMPGADLIHTEQPKPIQQRIADAQEQLENSRSEIAEWMQANPIPSLDLKTKPDMPGLAEARSKMEEWIKNNPIPGPGTEATKPQSPVSRVPALGSPTVPEPIRQRLEIDQAEMPTPIEPSPITDRIVKVIPQPAPTPQPPVMDPVRQRVETEQPSVPAAIVPEPIRQRLEIDQAEMPTPIEPSPITDRIVKVIPQPAPTPQPPVMDPVRQRVETEQPSVPAAIVPEPIRQRMEIDQAAMPRPIVPDPVRQRIEAEQPAVPAPIVPDAIRQRLEIDQAALPTPIKPEAIRQRVEFDVPTFPAIETPEPIKQGIVPPDVRQRLAFESPRLPRVEIPEPAQRRRYEPSTTVSREDSPRIQAGNDGETAKQLAAIEKLLSKHTTELEKIARETGRTTTATRRTATSVEQLEMPEVRSM